MLLRAFARHAVATGRRVRKFSIDVQSTTGHEPITPTGVPPAAGADISYVSPSISGRAFGLQNLIDWIDGIEWPY